MTVTYGSVCSGIEAASIAWGPLGMTPAWFSEIEPFPSAVLAHRWPRVANIGDMLAAPALISCGMIPAPDVLIGGTPCQSFSVAGARRGLSDERGQLTITYVETVNAIDKLRPGDECVAVWENVPGVLSSKDNAFGCFLGMLAGENEPLVPSGRRWTNAGAVSGPQRTIAWRVIDAQHFGVAQRRRRVYVVASARAGFDPAAVLFECEGVRRDSPPSREPEQETAGTLEARTTGGGFPGTDGACGGDVTPVVPVGVQASQSGVRLNPTVGTLDANYGSRRHNGVLTPCWWDGGQISQTLDAVLHKGQTVPEKSRFPAVLCAHGTQDPDVLDNTAHTLGRNSGQENAVFGIPGNWIGRKPENGGNATTPMDNLSPCLTGTDRHGVAAPLLVRRLTPTECARLQGFPDNHTAIPLRHYDEKKITRLRPDDMWEPCPSGGWYLLPADGPQYKAYGNSMAVPCVNWIGRRLLAELKRGAPK